MTRPLAPLLRCSLAVGLTLAPGAWPEAAAPQGRDRDIVVLRSERWIDTVRGTLKSLSPTPADEVVVVVRFRDARNKFLGTESVTLGPLEPGQEREFQVPMPEKVRKATAWEITPRALWRPQRR